MYKENDVIDGKYRVQGVCADTGGMGALLIVQPMSGKSAHPIVLKICKETEAEHVARFRREVRVMIQFSGNNRVIQVVDSNLEHDPPYFVMPYYSDGDLTNIAGALRADIPAQEIFFNKILDGIAELHAKNVFHRDIKPQNFLRNGNDVIVSDLGLCTELNSKTAFTRSSRWWGTPSYLPPEFYASGGFKNADAASDVFMIGKTFYFLLSERDPMYLLPEGVPGQLFAVIERCCAQAKANRYQTLASLRQSLTAAYDVLLGRVHGSALTLSTLRSILDGVKANARYKPDEVMKLIEEIAMLEAQEKIQIGLSMPSEIFKILAQAPVQSHLPQFLSAYKEMVDSESHYGYEFAGTIASHMKILFDSNDVRAADKAFALGLAIDAAYVKNRFAAMDMCRAMITNVTEAELAQRVHDLILEKQYSFITDIQEAACKAPAVAAALATIHKAQKEQQADEDIPF